jgi:VIT1/CCC1 family predicted Fe2+/Mn2+ transporter
MSTDPAAERTTRERVLDPVDRASETIFGLLMALTFTGALSVATAGQREVREMLVAALGCNLAWGLADAVMYLVRNATERVRGRQLLARLHAADAASGERLIAQALPERLQMVATPAMLNELYRQTRALPLPRERRLFTRSDWLGAAGVFALVVLATFPVVLPFLFFENVAVALRVSNALALAMLFGAGVALGRYAGGRPWLFGVAMAVTGALLVATIVLLGG